MIPVQPLSFSAMSLYRKCPGAYYARYIDPDRHLKEKPSAETIATLPGSVVHVIIDRAMIRLVTDGKKGALVDRFDWEKARDRKLLYAIFKSELEADPRIQLRPRPDEDGMEWATSEQTALKFIFECRDRLLDTIQTYGFIQPYMLAEWWFGQYKAPLVINDQLKVHGAVDLFTAASAVDAGRLVDWKAANSTKYLDYDQLKFYWLAALAKGMKVGMAGFVLFKRPGSKPEYMAFPKQELADAEERFTQYSKDIQAEKFPLTPSRDSCKMCDFRDQCPVAVHDEVAGKTKLPVVKATKAAHEDPPEL